jgi:hypothetical protein
MHRVNNSKNLYVSRAARHRGCTPTMYGNFEKIIGQKESSGNQEERELLAWI